MARALLRLRPDGIYEIVNQQRQRRVAFSLAALLVASTCGVVAAALLSAILPTSRAFLGGLALAAAGLLGLRLRAFLLAARMPLASTIQLRVPPPQSPLPRTGGAQDAGA